MAINRRIFLETSLFGGVALSLPFTSQAAEPGFIIGSCRLGENQFAVSKVDMNGRLQWQTPLPARGHATVIHAATDTALVVARRPGNFLTFLNRLSGDIVQQISLDDDLILNGHAIWTDDETLIVSGESKGSSKMCLLELKFDRQSARYRLRRKHHYEHLGPHEMILHNGYIWVAVGGLLMQGRDVLNKDSMVSGLLKLNAQTLTPESFSEAPGQNVSLRHLDADGENLIIAGQYQLDTNNSPTLLFHLSHDRLIPLDVDAALWPVVKGYIGSVKVLGDRVIATSPRAHWTGIFQTTTMTLETQRLASDVCALAKTPAGIVVGSGSGKLMISGRSMRSAIFWDNHFSYSSV